MYRKIVPLKLAMPFIAFSCNILLVVISFTTGSCQSMAFSLSSLQLSWGVRLEERYLEYQFLSLFECAKHCMRRKNCLSINFSEKLDYCELSYVEKRTGTRYYDNGEHLFVHSDIKHWDKSLIGNCQNHSCGPKEKCNEYGTCELSDCGLAPKFPDNSYAVGQGHHAIGNGFLLTCKDGYIMEGNGDNKQVPVKCGQNGQWVIPSFSCQDLQIKQFNSHQYYFSKTNKTWDESRTFCHNMGYTLLKIDSWDENRWIENNWEHVAKGYWIGGNDKQRENKWVWETYNTELDFKNWKNNFPKNNSRHCLKIRIQEGQWTNRGCDENRHFICEQLQ